MLGRIRRYSDHPNHQVFEISVHEDEIPDWEWRIRGNRQLSNLLGIVHPLDGCDPSFFALTDSWSPLTIALTDWIRTTLLRGIADTVARRLRHVSDIEAIFYPLSELIEPMLATQRCALRDYHFSIPLWPELKARYLRPKSVVATQPCLLAENPSLDTSSGYLEVYCGPSNDFIGLFCVERWSEGLYWICEHRQKFEGAILPGYVLLSLDALPSASLVLSEDEAEEDAYSPPPGLLARESATWLISTIIWPKTPPPPKDNNVYEHFLQQAQEVSVACPGLPGRTYSRFIAHQRLIEGRRPDDIQWPDLPEEWRPQS